jgi:hypothetical protein
MAMMTNLDWRPVAVGQLVARSNSGKGDYRATHRYGEAKWIAYCGGVELFVGSLAAVLESCEDNEREGTR